MSKKYIGKTIYKKPTHKIQKKTVQIKVKLPQSEKNL